jgi:hypothetical protein
MPRVTCRKRGTPVPFRHVSAYIAGIATNAATRFTIRKKEKDNRSDTVRADDCHL